MKRDSIVLLSAASLLLSSAVFAEEGDSLASALTSGKAGKWGLTGVYHDFSAETGSADLGTEFVRFLRRHEQVLDHVHS